MGNRQKEIIRNIDNFIFISKNNIFIEKGTSKKNKYKNENKIPIDEIDIKILISVPSLTKENYNYAIKNRDLIIDKSLLFLMELSRFKKLNISTNNLNLKKMSYRRDGYIEIVFNYKDSRISNYDKNNFY